MLKLRIREIMNEKGLGVDEVCSRLGTKRRSFLTTLYSRTSVNPTLLTLQRVAKALGVRVVDLIDEDGFVVNSERVERVSEQMHMGRRREYTCPYCGGVFDVREHIPRNVHEDVIYDED